MLERGIQGQQRRLPLPRAKRRVALVKRLGCSLICQIFLRDGLVFKVVNPEIK
jgi:hypothetical protein